jgi:two-component system chemotaxis response regulator CheY
MGLRVLLADDDEAMRNLILLGLGSVGVDTVVTAKDGDEALELLRQEAFDFVVIDWHMPGKSGEEIIRQVRAGGSQVPFLMVTAESRRPQVVAAVMAGATDYLIKPFDIGSLRAKLRRFCGSAKREEKPAQAAFNA